MNDSRAKPTGSTDKVSNYLTQIISWSLCQ